jgi:hypothetical protein
MIPFILHLWGANIKKKIDQAANWLKEKVRRKPATTTPANTTATKKVELDEDEYHDVYLKKLSGLDDVVVKLKLYERLGASLKYFYEMGRRDGALGIRLQKINNLAKSNAKEIFEHIYVVLNGKLAALQAEFDAVTDMKKNDEKSYKNEQAYYDYVKYQYRFFPRSHSILLFFLYAIVAFALILADIPLAIGLIREGFNLPGGEDLAALFRGDFWKTIGDSWEICLTSLGISLCTIYIKIYYDEFVGTPFASRFMTFRQFLAENDINASEDIVAVNKEHRRKVLWKTLFFFFTLLSILALALFRLSTAAKMKAAGSGGFEIDFFSGSAFVFITILFPLIGGICLSYALNNLQNRTRLWRARIQNKIARKRWLRTIGTATVVERNYNDMVAAHKRLSDETNQVKEYEMYLLASYERGYAIGGMQPQKYVQGEDFFTKIYEWRNLAISRKINHHICHLANEQNQ